jgi:hypothetical protein
VILRAAAALPHEDRRRATDALRRQLQVMAAAAGATPDWSTLAVAGPTERADADRAARFEWTAIVAVREEAVRAAPAGHQLIGSPRAPRPTPTR